MDEINRMLIGLKKSIKKIKRNQKRKDKQDAIKSEKKLSRLNKKKDKTPSKTKLGDKYKEYFELLRKKLS